jgi:hypothetical protein
MRTLIALAGAVAALGLPAQALADEGRAPVGVKVTGSAAHTLAGCREVDVYRYGEDIFGFEVYRFHQVKRWCWSYPRITSVAVSTYVSHVDPNMVYGGVVGATGRYYTWCCSNGRSGHYSFRQGKFQNCFIWIACTRTEYPWVKIWAHANGTFSWRTGV